MRLQPDDFARWLKVAQDWYCAAYHSKQGGPDWLFVPTGKDGDAPHIRLLMDAFHPETGERRREPEATFDDWLSKQLAALPPGPYRLSASVSLQDGALVLTNTLIAEAGTDREPESTAG